MTISIHKNIPLASKTSYRIGGPAKFYVEPYTEDEIIEACRYASSTGLTTLIIGNGSNLLICDAGVDGLVINLAARFTGIEWGEAGLTATVQSGFLLDDLAAEASRRGCVGMAELSGIPGTVGGAAVMNAGAFETDVAKTLRSVRVLRAEELKIEEVPASQLALGYRSSTLKGGNDVVISAVFEFKKGDAAEQLSVRERILNLRKEKQPIDSPSCGSVFKRPSGNYAGTLIQSCGLKGFKIGGAQVSEKHANFIINTGGAKAEDVRRVIRYVQKTVYESSGVLLEPEVIFVGEFAEPYQSQGL